MKKILVLLMLVSIGITDLSAQPEWRPTYSGILRVRLSDNYPITIALDGRYFEKHGPSLTIGDLPPGRHYLKIYTFTPDGEGEARAHLVFEGRVKVFRDAITNLIFNATTGDMNISEGNDDSFNEPEPEKVRGRKIMPEGPAIANVQPDTAVRTVEPKENKAAPPDLSKPPYPKLVKNDLDKLGNKVNAKVTDTDKLKELQSGLAKKALSTKQLKIVLTWLTFESSRVEFAKWAYSHTIDKQNFRDIVSSLKYQESKDELNGYINSAK
jgi:hypothetical protein